MNAQSNAAQIEQNPTKTINDLHGAFAGLVVSYVLTERETTGVTLECLEKDCEKLAMNAKALRLQADDDQQMSSAGIQAQAEQNQPNNSNDDSVLEPDFSHRYVPLIYGTNADHLKETITHTALRTNSVLSLIRKQFPEGSSGSLNYDEIYYSLMAAKMSIDDMSALISAFQQAANQDSSADMLPPIADDVFGGIDNMILRANGVLSLLCNRFAGNDDYSSNNQQLTGAIDLVMQEIAHIESIARDSGQAAHNQQA
jgi:hypothetical protein